MVSTLPSNLHAEIALDRGRLSHESPERSGARSISQARAMAADPPHARVQSLHGVIVETHAGPGYGSSDQRGYGRSPLSAQSGIIMPEADVYEEGGGNGTLSGADLAAALNDEDGWDDEEDEAIRMPHGGQGYDEVSIIFIIGSVDRILRFQKKKKAEHGSLWRLLAESPGSTATSSTAASLRATAVLA